MTQELESKVVEPSYFVHHASMGFIEWIWSFPFFSIILMVINLLLIVHVLKTGRPYYWIWIIFMMPVIGAAAYYFVEMKPRWRKVDWQQLSWKWKSPQARISSLTQIATDSPTVKNRSRLAREYELQGQWQLAANQYRDCLSGVFVDDPRLTLNLTSALLESNECDQANALILRVPSQRDPILEEERKLVLYRCKAASGQWDEAIKGLSDHAARSSSLGPKFYLAQAKSLAGRDEESVADLKGIVATFRRGNAMLRKSEEQWYRKANAMLKQYRVTQKSVSDSEECQNRAPSES